MNLVIEAAVVPAIFRNVDHPLKATIKSGVEDPSLCFGTAFNNDLSQDLIPSSLCRIPDPVKTPLWNLAAQISLCLLHADERNTVSELERPCAWTKSFHAIPVAKVFQLERNRRAEFTIDKCLHVAEVLFTADRGSILSQQHTGHAVGEHHGCLAVRKGKPKITTALGWGELGLNQRIVESGGIVIRRSLFLIVGRSTAISSRHDAEECLHPVGIDGQREGPNLVIQRVRAIRIHTHHTVRHEHDGACGLQQNANIADGGVHIFHLCCRMPRQQSHCCQNSGLDKIYAKDITRKDACYSHRVLHFNCFVLHYSAATEFRLTGPS